MTDRDRWPNDPNMGPSSQSAKPSGGCGKLTLIILSVGFLTLLLCCGVGTWFTWTLWPNVDNNPAAVNTMAGKILDLKVPAGFEPDVAVSSNTFLWTLNVATFQRPDKKGVLVLGHVQVKFAQNSPMDFQSRINEDRRLKDLKINKTEEREFEVQGKKIKFRFSEATETKTNQPLRAVEGELPVPGGTKFLKLFLHADEYNDEIAESLIKSIR